MNLQNIPSKNTEIRNMFVATPGYVLISCDYSKQELIVLADRAQDKNFIDALTSGKDVYAQIAAMAFHKTYEECLEFNPDGTTNKEGKKRRSQAKTIVLGSNYGRGAKSIGQQIGCSEKEAQKLLDDYFNAFSGIKQWQHDVVENARETGYVETVAGRKRRLPDMLLDEYQFECLNSSASNFDPLNFSEEQDDLQVDPRLVSKYTKQLNKSWGADRMKIVQAAKEDGVKITLNGAKIADASRECLNSPIQGGAADVTKAAMIKVHNDKQLKDWDCHILIPVHDELICECPEKYAKECSERIKQLMLEAAHDLIPLKWAADIEVTKAWYGEEIKL